MQSLTEIAGIDIQWAGDGPLVFGPDLVVDETASRLITRLRPVALDHEACTPANQVQYWMYNGVARRADRERLAATGMRYELTLMFPHPIGRERAKTMGHIHTAPPGSRLTYPEICEVLHGTAYFVFQTMDIPARAATFCAVLEAHPGDIVIVPPNLHHLTINGGDEPLLFADVIPLAAKGVYEPLGKLNGAAHLNTLDAGWIPNPAYRVVPDFQRWSAQPLYSDCPLYQTFVETPEQLTWMLEPARFREVFPELWKDIEAVIAA